MSRLVIRSPNHLGDFVMALPALQAAQPDALLMPTWLAPLGRMSGFQVIAFERGARGYSSAVLTLRRHNFGRGILLTPSFSSALMFRLAGVRSRRGTNTDGRTVLLTSVIDRELLEQQHRASAYVEIATGEPPKSPPVPALNLSEEVQTGARKVVRRQAPLQAPLIGICPGSHAASRTWPSERFADVANKLSDHATVIVFGAPSETAITRQVAGDWAIDMGGKTDLPTLAAGLSLCSLVISNDSGPLHLAAAVGARTLSIWGAGDPARTGPPPGHTILRHASLPCLECVKNQCPRRGSGYILPDAYNECLHLIGVEDVIAAARATVNK